MKITLCSLFFITLCSLFFISSTPTFAQTQPSETEVSNYLLKEINTYRSQHGLSSVKTSNQTCAFAKTRAKEIVNDFEHTGFRGRINNKTLPYNSWTAVTENIATTYDYKRVVALWIKSSSHAENMRKNTPFVCVQRHGNYYAYEGMKP